MDAAETFHVVNYRQEEWSAVDVSCSCKRGYKWTLCGHLERVIEQDQQVGRRKAKAMRIEGPVMLTVASILSNG